MKKLFAVIALMTSLLATNAVDAKFSDEYKAKYPKRVKITKTISATGAPVVSTRYKLFNRWLNDGPFELAIMDYNGIKICTICYGTNSSNPREFTHFTWGDGNNAYEIQLLSGYCKSIGPDRYSDFIDAMVEPTALKNAVVISVHDISLRSEPIIYESHKRWKEWQNAIAAAEKIMNDK